MHADPSMQIDSLFTTWAADVQRAHERAQTEHERLARDGDRSLERTLEVLSGMLRQLRIDARAALDGVDSPIPRIQDHLFRRTA